MLVNYVVIETLVVDQLICNLLINTTPGILFILLHLYREYQNRASCIWMCQYRC